MEKLQRVTKLDDSLLISSPYRKTNFRGLGSAQGQNGFGQSIPKKIMGCSSENSENKNVFAQKYDEIRSFDGMYLFSLQVTEN